VQEVSGMDIGWVDMVLCRGRSCGFHDEENKWTPRSRMRTPATRNWSAYHSSATVFSVSYER
jgi:hypothetical protein